MLSFCSHFLTQYSIISLFLELNRTGGRLQRAPSTHRSEAACLGDAAAHGTGPQEQDSSTGAENKPTAASG